MFCFKKKNAFLKNPEAKIINNAKAVTKVMNAHSTICNFGRMFSICPWILWENFWKTSIKVLLWISRYGNRVWWESQMVKVSAEFLYLWLVQRRRTMFEVPQMGNANFITKSIILTYPAMETSHALTLFIDGSPFPDKGQLNGPI